MIDTNNLSKKDIVFFLLIFFLLFYIKEKYFYHIDISSYKLVNDFTGWGITGFLLFMPSSYIIWSLFYIRNIFLMVFNATMFVIGMIAIQLVENNTHSPYIIVIFTIIFISLFYYGSYKIYSRIDK